MDREEFDSLCKSCPEDDNPMDELYLEVDCLRQNYTRINECLRTVDFLMDDSGYILGYLTRRLHPPELS